MSKRGNGEGSIYYSEKLKRWVGQVSLGYKNDGSPKRKSVYGKTRKEVNEKILNLTNDYRNNKVIEKSLLTLHDILDLVVDEQFNNNVISPTTYNRKKYYIKIISSLPIGNEKIQKITPLEINNSLSNITYYSNSVISKVSQLIQIGFNKAFLLNIINYNPFAVKGLILTPKSSKLTKKVDALTCDEQRLLVEELDKNYDTYTDIIKFALCTGARIGEILALDKSNIDLDNNIIHIKKTLTKDSNDKIIIGQTTKTYSGTRDIPITFLIKNIVVNRYNGPNFLLFSENGKIISPNTINSHFKRICKNANIRVIITKKKKHKNDEKKVNLKSSVVNTHMLRHTYATRCIESGMSAVVLSKLLGHSSVDTTLSIYTSVFNEFKQTEIDKYLIYMNQLH